MSSESRRLAGLLLVILPTVMIGGVSILTLLGVPLANRGDRRLAIDATDTREH